MKTKSRKTKPIFSIVAGILVFALPSCMLMDTATQQSRSPTALKSNSAKVTKGMTKEQVRAILGRPHSFMTVNNVTTWQYGTNNNLANTPYAFLGPLALIPFATGDLKQEFVTTTVKFGPSGRVTEVTRSVFGSNSDG